MWAASVISSWARSALATVSRQADVSVSVHWGAVGVGHGCASSHLGVVGITQVVLLVGWVGSLPCVRATDAVVRGWRLNGDECVVHVLVTVADLGVILPGGHALCAEEAVRTLGTVAVVSRSLTVISGSATATGRLNCVGNGVRPVAPAFPEGEVASGHGASSDSACAHLAVVAVVGAGRHNLQEFSSRAHAVCGVRVRLAGC